MIIPTVGRIVWYRPSQFDVEQAGMATDWKQPLASIVVYVHSERMVNLAVWDQNGVGFARTSVRLRQDDEVICENSGFAEWMPYQTAQATKHQEAEKARDASAGAAGLGILGALGLALLASVIASVGPAKAADLPAKQKAAAPVNYSYTSCGPFFGIDTVAVTGSATEGEIGGLIGYACPINANAFWFVEGDFNFASLNTTTAGVSLNGPASFTQRVALGTPVSNLLSLFPSLGLQLPALPILPAGVSVVSSQSYLFGALHEQDIGVYNGLAAWRQWQFSPGVGMGVLNYLSDAVALDLFAEAQFLDKSFCAPANLGGCNNVGTLYRVGMALKY